MSDGARLTVICALASEAQALIELWRLPSLRERPFRVFGDEPARIVISGVGSHACAAAVGYAAGLREARADDIWLNLGIAGHGTHGLGTALLAARISHHGRDGAWYPSLLFTPPCAVAELETHDSAVTDYPPRACVKWLRVCRSLLTMTKPPPCSNAGISPTPRARSCASCCGD